MCTQLSYTRDKRATEIGDRFLAAEKQFENERASNGVHRRHDDVGELGVHGDLELRKIRRPAFPSHL